MRESEVLMKLMMKLCFSLIENYVDYWFYMTPMGGRTDL